MTTSTETPRFSAIEHRTATEYPTRYCAFDNPGILWEQTEAIQRFETASEHTNAREIQGGGYEYAVFYAPQVNAAYPHITDGTYASIVSYQGKSFLAEYHYTEPSTNRGQVNKGSRVATYTEALALVKGWLANG